MEIKPTPRVHADLLRAVNEQLASPETVEVKQAYDRLVASGHEPGEAKEVIATLLTLYINRMLRRKQAFDYQGYCRDLAVLPVIDWDRVD